MFDANVSFEHWNSNFLVLKSTFLYTGAMREGILPVTAVWADLISAIRVERLATLLVNVKWRHKPPTCPRCSLWCLWEFGPHILVKVGNYAPPDSLVLASKPFVAEVSNEVCGIWTADRNTLFELGQMHSDPELYVMKHF